jgi:hypothetical protein
MTCPSPSPPPRVSPLRHRLLAALRALLALGFVLALFVPLLQQATGILPEWPLGGAEPRIEPVALTVHTWLDGSYAKAFEARYTQTFGWRPMLVRLANQFRYDLSGQAPRSSGSPVTIGKEDWLYENAYLRHYSRKAGGARPGEGDALVGRLRAIHAALAAKGIAFAVVVSPSKPEVYPEYLPAAIVKPRQAPPNAYEVVVPKLRAAGIPLVDAQAMFPEWKRQRREALFASTGTHWNYVGAFLALQQVLETWRAQLGDSVPRPELAGTDVGPPRGSDDDLARLLNLMRFGGAAAQRLPFPRIRPDTSPGSKPLRVGIVGDSFSYTLVDELALSHAASEVSFLYYAKRRHHYPLDGDARGSLQNHAERAGEPIDAATFDWAAWLTAQDAVLLECNATMVLDEFWGFAEHAAASLSGRRP